MSIPGDLAMFGLGLCGHGPDLGHEAHGTMPGTLLRFRHLSSWFLVRIHGWYGRLICTSLRHGVRRISRHSLLFGSMYGIDG